MASYTRLGSHLLATELATDPFGKIHRGLSIVGSKFEKHVLVRTFCEDLLDSGLGQKLREASPDWSLFAGTRGFASGSMMETGRATALVCDYIPGRSLAQVLEKTKREQLPLGVDHALSVLQSLGQSIIQMHSKEASHGVLSPHSIWVSFEGATHLMDAPIAGVLQTVLPKARVTAMSIERYRRSGRPPLQQDFFSLGALFYELLTLEKLPAFDLLPTTLSKATLKAAQDDSPIPPEILGLLKRLLGLQAPYETAEAFNSEMERVLYDGDYSPTTFNMAFFMHTLFREENDQDLQAMKEDQTADFTPFMESDTGHRSMMEGKDGRNYGTLVFVVASIIVAVVSFFGYNSYQTSKLNKQLLADLAKVQQEQAINDQKLKDISHQEEAAKQQKEALSATLEKGSAQEKADARRRLDDIQKEEERLASEKQATLRKQQELRQRTDSVKQLVTAGKPPETAKLSEQPVKPPVDVPTKIDPVRPDQNPIGTALPTPTQPTPTQPTPAQPTPVQPTPTQTSSAGDSSADAEVKILNQVSVRHPVVARRMKFETSLDHHVIIKAFVDATGKPRRAIIVEGVAGSYGFDEEATNAIMASTFTPAMKGGKAVGAWITVKYSFPKGN